MEKKPHVGMWLDKAFDKPYALVFAYPYRFLLPLYNLIGIFPSINASHVKHIYRIGLKEQGIRKDHDILPELRVDRGSPNTSLVTKEFFEIIGAELSFARTRRPTDNAFTERFFGTAKQEEIYLVGSYPDECSAWEEMGSYIYTYNHERPHQSLWNFTPLHVHTVNNNTLLLEELTRLKHVIRLRRREYWEQQRLTGLDTKEDLQNYAILSK